MYGEAVELIMVECDLISPQFRLFSSQRTGTLDIQLGGREGDERERN